MVSVRKALRPLAERLGLIGPYFRWLEWRASRGGEAPPADAGGLALPPPYLMMLVGGNADWRAFLEMGATAAAELDAGARAAGVPFAEARRILDFGCGCGRIARHLPAMTGAAVAGVDVNARLVRWCAKNLKGDFARSRPAPPLDFPDGAFDIIYLVSVFTHLKIETQRAWLAEFARLLRPGGVALVTFHDEDHPTVPDEAARGLRATGAYIHNDRAEGSNFIATFQSRDFSRRLFAERLEVFRIAPSGQTRIGHALAVLRRPALPS